MERNSIPSYPVLRGGSILETSIYRSSSFIDAHWRRARPTFHSADHSVIASLDTPRFSAFGFEPERTGLRRGLDFAVNRVTICRTPAALSGPHHVVDLVRRAPPASATDRDIGTARRRFGTVTPSALTLPARICGSVSGMLPNMILHLAGDRDRSARVRPPLYGHVHELHGR
jgi:hypothetical protein